VVLTTANFGVSVISAGTIHDLGRVKVPGTNQLNTNAPGKPKQVTSKQKPNSPQ
jgi:hypothetical protein